MPFGLQVASLLFQNVIINIFKLMLQSILIYIDDVLLFSQYEESHTTLLK